MQTPLSNKDHENISNVLITSFNRKEIIFLNLSLSKQTRQFYDEIAIRDELIVLE